MIEGVVRVLACLAGMAVAWAGLQLLRRRPKRCPWCQQPVVFESLTPYSRLRVFGCGSTCKEPGGARRSNECRRAP